jgi:hypothetical protein
MSGGVVYYRDIVRARFGGDTAFRVNEMSEVLTRVQKMRVTNLIGDAAEDNKWLRATIINASGEEVVDESRTSESFAVDLPDLAHGIRETVAERV